MNHYEFIMNVTLDGIVIILNCKFRFIVKMALNCFILHTIVFNCDLQDERTAQITLVV